MSMRELSYTVSFTTPAFLGNAEQQAQWRTPPFKALLRQWWRIAAAADFNYDYQQLREAEGRLFGQAHEGNNRKSQVRVRLNHWNTGKLNQWSSDNAKITHPEVKFPVGSDLYLGYGPLAYDKKSKAAKLGVNKGSGQSITAIQPESDNAELWIAFPGQSAQHLKRAAQLAGWFGTLGSRSRNGWGSLQYENDTLPKAPDLASVSRPLSMCLQQDWPHAIGADNRGVLVWKTTSQNSWRDAMRELARIKIAFRSHFKFTTGRNASRVESRHILAYPVTNHDVRLWGNQGRLGNQIRFKVYKESGRYVGLIVHLPCKLPAELSSRLQYQSGEVEVWQQVHGVLDQYPGLSRLA